MLDWLNDIFTRLLIGLAYPIDQFIVNGSSRYFWLYCVSGIIIALAVTDHGRRRHPGERALFDPANWTGPSARADYFILVADPVIRMVLLSWAYFNWEPLAAWIASSLHSLGVTGVATDSTSIGLGVLLTLTLFVVDDFIRWVVHYYMHKIPELWEFHKVHHSAEELNFATAERHHPVEILLGSFGAVLGYGLVNGIFIALFGDKLTVLTLFGANIFLVVFNICGGALRHSPVWISFGPTVERWVISPAMHQIHHSAEVRHYDMNMGASLAVWDRIFGTIYIPKERDIKGFGIGEETRDFYSLKVVYFRPLIRSAELFAERVKRWRSQPSRPVSTGA